MHCSRASCLCMINGTLFFISVPVALGLSFLCPVLHGDMGGMLFLSPCVHIVLSRVWSTVLLHRLVARTAWIWFEFDPFTFFCQRNEGRRGRCCLLLFVGVLNGGNDHPINECFCISPKWYMSPRSSPTLYHVCNGRSDGPGRVCATSHRHGDLIPKKKELFNCVMMLLRESPCLFWFLIPQMATTLQLWEMVCVQ